MKVLSSDVTSANKNLKVARAATEKTYETRGGASRQYYQWLDQINRMHTIASQQRMPEQIRDHLGAWALESTAAMTEEEFCAAPILGQWGLIEIVCVFCNVLNRLVAQCRYSEAFSLLVRAQHTLSSSFLPYLTRWNSLQEYWTMQRMIERTVCCVFCSSAFLYEVTLCSSGFNPDCIECRMIPCARSIIALLKSSRPVLRSRSCQATQQAQRTSMHFLYPGLRLILHPQTSTRLYQRSRSHKTPSPRLSDRLSLCSHFFHLAP